jgi:diguanylate cyclase (GGDEF)-like protein
VECAILTAALGLLTGVANAQEITLVHYASAEGLPAPRVTASLQDAAGFLWFGTPAGVARYDGTAFRVFTTADGLSGNDVVALVEDAGGRVLVATRDGAVDVIDGEQVSRLPGAVERGQVTAMQRGADGGVYLAGPNLAASTAQGELLSLAGALPDGCCTVVSRDRRGRLWLGSRKGLYAIDAGQVRRLRGIDAEVTSLLDTASGMTIGTRDGLYRVEAGRLRLQELDLPSQVVLTLHPDPVEGVWVGTDAGVARVVGSVRERIDAASGIRNARVNTALVDHEDTLWMGTDGGLVKWVPSSFATYTSGQGLVGDYVVGVAPDPSGGVWAASRGAVVRITGEGTAYSVFEVGDETIGAFSRSDTGDLYIGVGRRLMRWRRGREAPEKLASLPDRITALVADAQQVWIGTDRGLHRFAGGETSAVELPFQDRVTAMVVDSEQALWAGTSREGLWRRQVDGEFVRQLAAVPLPTVWHLLAVADGSVWAATNGAGAVRFTPGGDVIALTHAGNALSSDFVQQVLIDRDDVLWLYTNRGLDRWDPATGVEHFELGDGLASMTGAPAAGVAASDGTLWLGTPVGLTVFRRRASRGPTSTPRVILQRVELNGEPVPAERLLSLRSEEGPVSFFFTALTFRDEASTRFRYRLLGRGDSEDWSMATPERRVSFVGLPPGDYTFEVQAIDDRSVYSLAPAAVPLHVRPALWQANWFRGLLIGLGLFAIALYFRRRLRSVDDERQRLRQMVDRRTRELVEKNALLERMATTDELTGLPNRRFFLESMQRELRKMTRATIDEELSLLLIDLDRFKNINDRFGHPAGDDVLREVARRFSRGVRATDLPARYGGEEFAILLPGTGTKGAQFLGEKLRADMEALELRFEGERIPVTISVGVATIDSPDRYDPEIEEQLLRRADEALYEAKDTGRNRVVVAA